MLGTDFLETWEPIGTYHSISPISIEGGQRCLCGPYPAHWGDIHDLSGSRSLQALRSIKRMTCGSEVDAEPQTKAAHLFQGLGGDPRQDLDPHCGRSGISPQPLTEDPDVACFSLCNLMTATPWKFSSFQVLRTCSAR